jgi:predicted dinucleotide-binding enzyme
MRFHRSTLTEPNPKGAHHADRYSGRRECGGALGKAWAQTGHRIAYGVPDAHNPKHTSVAAVAGGARVASVREAAEGAEVIVLAVPFAAVPDALAACGDLSGRIVIDAMNPLGMGPGGLELSLGYQTSAGEQVAALAPRASVFKTLNQAGFETMADSSGFPTRPVMFVAGDDEARKPDVLRLVSDLGFEAVHAGGIAISRLLGPFAMLWIHMAVNRGMGTSRAFAWPARR